MVKFEEMKQPVTTLILCGGLGTRLRPLIGDNLPKVLAPIGGRAFLDYQLRYLRHYGLTDIILCTGFGADMVRDYCGDGARWGIQIKYSQEVKPLGTGGALKLAQSQVQTEVIFILNGDSMTAADFSTLIRAHTGKKHQVTLGLIEVQDRSRFGSVELSDNGEITSFGEKGCSGAGLINAGIYVMNRKILDDISEGCFVSLEKEIFPGLIGNGMFGQEVKGPFIDIGIEESYLSAKSQLADCMKDVK